MRPTVEPPASGSATAQVPEAMTESWLNMLGTVCWAQDQGERILNEWKQLGQMSREEGVALMTRLAHQVRQNQEEMQRWIDSSVKMSLAAFTPPTRTQVEELARKVEELSRKVEELGRKA